MSSLSVKFILPTFRLYTSNFYNVIVLYAMFYWMSQYYQQRCVCFIMQLHRPQQCDLCGYYEIQARSKEQAWVDRHNANNIGHVEKPY